MLTDIQALIDRGDNLNAKDQQGATLVRDGQRVIQADRETNQNKQMEAVKCRKTKELSRKRKMSIKMSKERLRHGMRERERKKQQC